MPRLTIKAFCYQRTYGQINLNIEKIKLKKKLIKYDYILLNLSIKN